MKYFFLTGDPSGDRIGALIARHLLQQDSATVTGWGGKHLRDAGVTVLRDTDDLAVMGYKEVIQRILFFQRLIGRAKVDILRMHPDVLVLVDYGSFNLRIAKWASQKGVSKVLFLSPPKLWASRPSRIKLLKRYCDKVIVLFPFEQTYYRLHGLAVEYYGHPFASSAIVEPRAPSSQQAMKAIALLPGSRMQEIRYILPIMVEAISSLSSVKIIISKAPNIQHDLILSYIPPELQRRLTISEDRVTDVLRQADMALVTSGTATIEAALANVPQVVCYKTSAFTYAIAKRIIRVKYISLVNLMLDRPLVKELIQGDCTSATISAELRSLDSRGHKNSILKGYGEIKAQLLQPNTIESIANAIRGTVR